MPEKTLVADLLAAMKVDVLQFREAHAQMPEKAFIDDLLAT